MQCGENWEFWGSKCGVCCNGREQTTAHQRQNLQWQFCACEERRRDTVTAGTALNWFGRDEEAVMKLCFGTASIASRKFALTISALILLGTGLLSGAVANDNAGRTTKTELALACLLGMAHPGCETAFEGATLDRNVKPLAWNDARRLITYCTGEYVHRALDHCSGPLETVRYLGTNAAGDDVYDVGFMTQDMTYVISPPGPDGKIPALWIFNDPPSRVLRRDVVTVTSPMTPAPTIYHRTG
jgi:hypothetical protein